MKTRMPSVVATLTTLGAVLLLTACGQKGPLTLPAKAPAAAASGAAR